MTIEERSDAAHNWTNHYREAFAAIGGDAVVEIMRAYLEDEDFGFDAGLVLKEIWDRDQNTPAASPLKTWPDFSTVAARREQRRAEAATAAAPAAATIFAAIERMVAPGSSEKRQRVAIALGRIGLIMPHGNQRAAIDALLALPLPVRGKRELLAALVLDGEVIGAELPAAGYPRMGCGGAREGLDAPRRPVGSRSVASTVAILRPSGGGDRGRGYGPRRSAPRARPGARGIGVR